MTDISASMTTCKTLIDALLARTATPDWLDWLPLLQTAADAPVAYLTAFQELSLEQQFQLIECLRLPGSGPLADGLLILLASRAEEIEDQQVRLYLLEDAQDAWERHRQRLETLQAHLEPLTEAVTEARQRLEESFEQAQEIIRLEQALAQLQARETEAQAQRSRIDTLRQHLAGWRDILEAGPAEESRLREEQDRLRQAVAEQERRLQEQRDALADQRRQLEALEAASRQAGLDAVTDKVREVYALLPADLADRSFG